MAPTLDPVRCPNCGGTLTYVHEGKTAERIFFPSTGTTGTFWKPNRFLSCNGCEFLFDERTKTLHGFDPAAV